MSDSASLPPLSASMRVRDVELTPADTPQRHREKLARIVLNEMFQFVALLDVNGTLLEVNRAALEGAGIRLEDILGKPFWEARWWTVSKQTQEQQRQAVERAASGEFVRFDVEVFGSASGSETIVIDYSLIPVKDREGRVVFLLPEGRNITEKKRAEAEIARKNQELEALLARVRELDELKSQFFANVSHELRTPLALILGPAERILAQAENLTAGQRRDLEVMRRNATMLLKHVNDLLDVSKLDAGRMSAAYSEVDLAQLVRVVASHFDALAPQRQVTYLVDAPPALIAQVDVEKLERIVLNLLSNAFKFVPDGGTVALSLREVDNDRVLLTVQDSGPGVPVPVRDAIFERFRQAEGGSTRQFGGTGLGLSIASDFVRLHGGTIGVTDAPGGGALFQVALPRTAPEGARVRSRNAPGPLQSEAVLRGALEELAPETRAPPPAQRLRDAAAPRALVVEDNPEMRRFIAESLADDFEVVTAEDGRRGLERALELCPEVIVTDLMMPGMSGDQMVFELRKRPEMDGTPVLVLSARADDGLRMRLLREGAQDYLVKPFSAQELQARAKNLAAMKRTRDILKGELSTQEEDIARLAEEIAERKHQLERALESARHARAEAERAGRVREAFLRMASHELRTPVTTVSLDLQRLSKEPERVAPDGLRRVVERSRRALRRLHGAVESVLEYTRVESDSLAAEPRLFDPCALVRDLAEELSQQAYDETCPPTRVRLEVQADGAVPSLTSDPHLVRLILRELVTNALKHAQQASVSIGVRHDGETHRFWVKDTGPGIPSDQQAEIFEPFHQLAAVERKHVPGLGLGLALVRHTVALLDGKVVLDSQLGRGTTFTLQLPHLDGSGARPRMKER